MRRGYTPVMHHPELPGPRGPLSAAVLDVLAGRGTLDGSLAGRPVDPATDPYGDDLQLALYVLYELHYRGFDGVDAELEWDPDLLSLRRELERLFSEALQRDVPASDDVDAEVAALLVEPVEPSGPAAHLEREGELWQLREYVAHRSLYHLKEADPQAWVIPRLQGRAKASLVTVEHDEFGAGRAEHAHSRLFAEMMADLDLDDRYGAYVDAAPAATLATVNAMSLWGLHRRWRGALVGQFALVEITSPPGSARLVKAMQRLGASEVAQRFYDEHVEADAVHEQLVRHDLLGGLLADEPHLAADVVFGLRAATFLDDRLDDQLLRCWSDGVSSLRDGAGDRTLRRWLVSQNG